VGLPTWFSVPFGELFGLVEIDYTPKYKVYVFQSAEIAPYTTIHMQSLSNEVGLGTALQFNADGAFTQASGQTQPDSIILTNNRPAGTANLTVGLAAEVNLPSGKQFLPFCAFSITPQATIVMTPQEKIALFAAQVDLQSGSVVGQAVAPGCSFSFGPTQQNYNLTILPSTFQVTNAPTGAIVSPIPSGQGIIPLLQ
jgi:hypothetical protein